MTLEEFLRADPGRWVGYSEERKCFTAYTPGHPLGTGPTPSAAARAAVVDPDLVTLEALRRLQVVSGRYRGCPVDTNRGLRELQRQAGVIDVLLANGWCRHDDGLWRKGQSKKYDPAANVLIVTTNNPQMADLS